jgi:hypothetical protein
VQAEKDNKELLEVGPKHEGEGPDEVSLTLSLGATRRKRPG